jgi:nicotinamide mononucleotide transporter
MELGLAVEQAWLAMSWWEVAAVLLGIAYLLLAMIEHIGCWYAAFLSTAIYTFLFWDVSLFMDSALQLYYMAMAVYGWWQWQQPTTNTNHSLAISQWRWQIHCGVIGLIIGLSLMSGYLLDNNTSAEWAYLDSFTTWGAVITTYMVTKKILENWLYWLVIDAVAAYLYFDKELYLTSLLFCVYLIMVIFGYFQWRKIYRQEQSVRQ